MTQKPDTKAALHEAISAIYFSDSSDYLTALWQVVKHLGGDDAVKLLEETPREAFKKYHPNPDTLD